MVPMTILSVFFMTSILLALAPGPDNIFVLTQAALRGRLAGLVITLGLCTGLIFHTLAIAFGVAAIFQASAAAFTVLKLIGAAYLAYLAFRAFRATSEQMNGQDEPRLSLCKLYQRGIIMNITNPKVSIFFLAFLPQFADPGRGSITLQMLLLGVIFIVAALLVFGVISFFAGLLGEQLRRSPRAQVVLNRIAGTVYSALAIKLATAGR